MDNNTKQLIESLAEQLGTTSKYLWSVLVSQAPIDATITLIQITIVLIYGISLYKIHKYLDSPTKDSSYTRYENSEITPILMIIGCIILAFLFIVSICAIDNIITGYFNPEYWALEKILDKIK